MQKCYQTCMPVTIWDTPLNNYGLQSMLRVLQYLRYFMNGKESDKLGIKLIYVDKINYTLDFFANIVKFIQILYNFSHRVKINKLYYSLSFFC